MQLEEFVDKVRNSKYGSSTLDLRVSSNKDRIIQVIRSVVKCHRCNTEKSTGLKVEFYEEQELTVFQAELLYYLYCLNKKPVSYVRYHECIAGKRFIENSELLTPKS